MEYVFTSKSIISVMPVYMDHTLTKVRSAEFLGKVLFSERWLLLMDFVFEPVKQFWMLRNTSGDASSSAVK